jgi:hypothetical protein
VANRRMIARNVATSKKISCVSEFAEIVWYRSQPFADDFGRLTADPEVLRATIIPMGRRGKQVGLGRIEDALEELERAGLLYRYSVNGDTYMEFTNFDKFQTMKSDRNPKAEYPEPRESIGIQGNPLEASRAGALTEPNLTKPIIGASYSPAFLEAKKAYPPRKGNQNYPAAWRGWQKYLGQKLEDRVLTEDDLLLCCRNYYNAEAAAGHLKTEYVMQMSTFFGKDARFLEYLVAEKSCGTCAHGGYEPTYCVEAGQTVNPDDKPCEKHEERTVES